MTSFKKTAALLVSIAALSLTLTTEASAREGGWRSVGKGIKCINQAVLQPNGTYRVQQVCAHRG